GALLAGDADHQEVFAGSDIEGQASTPLGLGGVEVEGASGRAVDGDGGDASIRGLGEDPRELTAVERERGLASGDVAEADGMGPGLLEVGAAVPIAAVQDAGVEVVVVAAGGDDFGTGGAVGNLRRGAVRLQARDEHVVVYKLGNGAVCEEIAQHRRAQEM